MTATIAREELKAKVDRRERFKLVEALPEEAFQKGHLPGAIDMPSDRVRELAPQLIPDKAAETVLYCSGPT